MGGIIKWFHLEKLWQSLSDTTKEQIKQNERKSVSFSITAEDDSPIDSGEVIASSQTKSHALREMGIGLPITESERILWMAYDTARSDIDRHLALLALSNLFYRYRDDPQCLQKCIKVCEMDTNLYPQLKHSKSFTFTGYDGKTHEPNYPSFERLAIIFEKVGDYESAIKVTERCISLSAPVKTDPQRRLQKLRRKV